MELNGNDVLIDGNVLTWKSMIFEIGKIMSKYAYNLGMDAFCKYEFVDYLANVFELAK